MPFRFQRRFRILPGLRLNLSKSGVSTSIGTRGAWFMIGPRGTRTTVGLPGTGLSCTEQTSARRSAPKVTSYGEIPSTQPVDAENASTDPGATEQEPALSALAVILALAVIVALVAGAIAIFR